jgi:hypothetical protein
MRTHRFTAFTPSLRRAVAGVLAVALLAGCASGGDDEKPATETATESSAVLELSAELVTFETEEAAEEPAKLEREELISMLTRTPGSFFLASKRVTEDKKEVFESLGRATSGDFTYDAKAEEGSFHFRFVAGTTYIKVNGSVKEFFKGGEALGKKGWEVVPHELTRSGQDWAIPSGVDANPFGVSGGIGSILTPDAKLTVGNVETRNGVKMRRYELVDAQGSEWVMRLDGNGRLRSLENKRAGNVWEFAYNISIKAPQGASERDADEIESLLSEGDMAAITQFALSLNEQVNAMKADIDGNPIQSSDRRVMALVHSVLHGELPQGVTVSAEGKMLYNGSGEHAELENLPEKVTYLEFTKRGASVCLRLTADGKRDVAHQDDLKVGKLLSPKGSAGWAIMHRSTSDPACSKVK